MTPDVIKRTGCRVKAELTELRLQTLNQTLNALNMARQQGLITRIEAIRLAKLPGYRTPERTIREVDIEGLKDMPEYKSAAMLRYVVEEEKDPILAELVLQQLTKARREAATDLNGPPGGQPPGPGGPPPGGPAQTPGMSLPGMGMPPGPGSGPPGPLGGGPSAMPISPDIGARGR